MEAFASPDQWSDEVLSFDDSPFGSDEEKEDTVWILQEESSDTLGSARLPEDSCATFEPARLINMDRSVEATCSRFSMDGSWLAVGTRNGPIQIYSVGDGRLAFTLDVLKAGLKRWPCTALCVRPSNPGDSSYNVLLSCDLSGQIHYWHITSGMHLGTSKEQYNSVYTIDFDPAGVKYATSGSDCKVRVYEASTRAVLQTLSGGNGTTTAGHSNRVFAVKWHPTNVHVALSGGWDNTIQIWDLRTRYSVRSIYGPKICGDALDVRDTGDAILSGSWRGSHQLQVSRRGDSDILDSRKEEPCRLYAARYGIGVSKKLIVAGGSGSNETCLFAVDTGQVIARLPDSEKATYSLTYSMDGSLLAATSEGTASIIDLKRDLLRFDLSSGQPKGLQSPVKSSKPSRMKGVRRSEIKPNAQSMGSRSFRHTGTLIGVHKTK